MAIIVEDGTGRADAETLCSVAFFRAFCAGRGMDLTGLDDDAAVEILLRKATDFMRSYSAGLQGARVSAAQALDWPRAGVVAYGYTVESDTVPAGVQQACALLAHKAKSGPLSTDLTQAVTRQVIGPIEKEFDPRSPQFKRYPDVERLIVPFMASANPFSVKLVRV